MTTAFERKKEARLSITNVIQNSPQADCFIREIPLYTPGDRQHGFINHEWNNHGFGSTGSTGFDVLRWKWITYHLEGRSIPYTVRWGDTFETIAFDWKVSPQSILDANPFPGDLQLTPGQVIT
ncbi:MAG TPA: LysM domain-containing protein [Anaerolineales bacterium]|nr:LysM domain-containing protein [Anaerolineales bacterium]